MIINRTLAVTILICIASTVAAQEEQETKPKQEQVVANVSGTEITESRVQRHLDRTIGDRSVTPEQRKILRLSGLQHLVDREIINQFLIGEGIEVGPNQVRLEIDILVGNLERVGQTLDEFLAKQHRTQASLEAEIEWKIRWRTYLEQSLTDTVMQNYFQRNRRRFDGTEIRVAQILWRINDSPDSTDQALATAKQVKADLDGGKLSWAEAVRTHSTAPSRDKGGELGWIRYSEPMPPDFSQKAFGLDVQETSEPFASKFGVHVLKCLEVKAGTLDLGDIRELVEEAAIEDLFHLLASRHRSKFDIEYEEGWQPKDQ